MYIQIRILPGPRYELWMSTDDRPARQSTDHFNNGLTIEELEDRIRLRLDEVDWSGFPPERFMVGDVNGHPLPDGKTPAEVTALIKRLLESHRQRSP